MGFVVVPNEAQMLLSKMLIDSMWILCIDAGKWVCDLTLPSKPRGCTVFSIGSNGDVSFEKAVHAEHPGCAIHTFDHTLDPKKTKEVRLPMIRSLPACPRACCKALLMSTYDKMSTSWVSTKGMSAI